MKVLMLMDDDDCVLRIEPEDEEGRALLAAFGVSGGFARTLGSQGQEPCSSRITGSYEGSPVEID
ncbi:hypothetical protein [Accumulibacter sp.]|uniref:hypothetical protein n=1 Tax=Accumulibacter sp. TaxID=2053492 RepID=UPI0025FBECA5|nr:hypothetical protein [Accumulibacter sp.]MCM8596585.1 hypothetical protein [Accumulibacter sp.]MCM8624570.1 hypothetical protein [Accumulibacter sp.]MDS4050733.1 hypothetical protein [Accumulibacter sp.]